MAVIKWPVYKLLVLKHAHKHTLLLTRETGLMANKAIYSEAI